MANTNHDDHTHVTHWAPCDAEGCLYKSQVHAHSEDDAVSLLSQDLADHNEKEHDKQTDPEKIEDDVREKMITN